MLVPVVCPHGNRLSVRKALPGAVVLDPACKDSKGNPRPHVAGESAKK